MADLAGPGSGLTFAGEVQVEDGCAVHLWTAEGFRWEGTGAYSPGTITNLTGEIAFDRRGMPVGFLWAECDGCLRPGKFKHYRRMPRERRQSGRKMLHQPVIGRILV